MDTNGLESDVDSVAVPTSNFRPMTDRVSGAAGKD
jgi:hypothetical protein